MESWPGTPYPLGATFDGSGTNFALFSEVAERVELCLIDGDGREAHRGADRAHRGRRVRLALLPAVRAARAALRLPRPRSLGSRTRPAVQPEQAAAGPLRQGHQRRDRLGPVALRLRLRGPGLAQRRRLRPPHDVRRRDQPVLRLGGRPDPPRPVQRDGHLRGPRQGAHPAPPRRPRGAAGHVRRPGPPRRHRPPDQAGRDRDRADAGPPVRPGQHAAGQGAAQLLGLQHARVLRPARRLRGDRRGRAEPRPAGAGVQVDGQVDACGGHRGDPGRRLQPHRRGQPPRPDPQLQGDRQPGVLPAGRGRAAVLHGLHRDRQLPERAAPTLPSADHGLAALLGDRDARRRFPVRSGLGPGPRVLRRRPPGDVLRARAAGPGGEPGEADRRAVGRRPGRLPGRELPSAVDRVERRLPRHRPRLLARRAVAG